MDETPQQIRERGLAAVRDAGPTRVDRWRAENPGAVVREWPTASGGWVTQLPNYTRLYCHLCDDCGHLIVLVRDIRDKRKGSTQTGRWPSYCSDCRRKRSDTHDKGAAERMRRVRGPRKAFRDEQFRRAGIPLPKPRGRNARK